MYRPFELISMFKHFYFYFQFSKQIHKIHLFLNWKEHREEAMKLKNIHYLEVKGLQNMYAVRFLTTCKLYIVQSIMPMTSRYSGTCT